MPQDVLQPIDPRTLSRLANLELRARLVVEGFIAGLHRSPYHGFSVEFAEHRQYAPGDELRHVDWKVYGRTDRYYVKRFEEETNLKAYLLVDTSASMGYASPGRMSKFDYAVSLAAALAYLMIRQRDAVGLATFDEGIREYYPPRSTRIYLRSLLSGLQAVRPSGLTGAGKALHQLADRIKRRGLVIVLSDLFDDPDDAPDSRLPIQRQGDRIPHAQLRCVRQGAVIQYDRILIPRGVRPGGYPVIVKGRNSLCFMRFLRVLG